MPDETNPDATAFNTRPDTTIGSEECAALLRCTVGQVEELARAGEIPGLKFGRGWIFVRYDLLAYLAERARSEAAERRSKRQRVSVMPVTPKQSRQRTPPTLPVPPPAEKFKPDGVGIID